MTTSERKNRGERKDRREQYFLPGLCVLCGFFLIVTGVTPGKHRGERKDRREKYFLSGLCVLCGFFFFVTPAAAQYQVLGKAKCINCHDHENEKVWSEKKDGPPPNNHLNALRQLETPKSETYAKAVGLADPYDAKGSCATCHGTTLKGAVVDGVTCESCHGPASGYVDIHQQKGAYRQSVAAGLADTQKNPDAWAPLCVKCHVMKDAKLIQAGHPLRRRFRSRREVRHGGAALEIDLSQQGRHCRARADGAGLDRRRARTDGGAGGDSAGGGCTPAAPPAQPIAAPPAAGAPAVAQAAPAAASIAQPPRTGAPMRAASSAAAQPIPPVPPALPVAPVAPIADPGAAAVAVSRRCGGAGTPHRAARQPAAPRRALGRPDPGATTAAELQRPRRGTAAAAGRGRCRWPSNRWRHRRPRKNHEPGKRTRTARRARRRSRGSRRDPAAEAVSVSRRLQRDRPAQAVAEPGRAAVRRRRDDPARRRLQRCGALSRVRHGRRAHVDHRDRSSGAGGSRRRSPAPSFLESAGRVLGRAAKPDVVQRRAGDATVPVDDVPVDLTPNQDVLLEAGDVFGEMSALSRYPVSADVVARTDVTCLLIRVSALRMMFKQKELAGFKKMSTSAIARRTLANQLRSVELFAGLDEESIAQLQTAAQLSSLRAGQRHRRRRRAGRCVLSRARRIRESRGPRGRRRCGGQLPAHAAITPAKSACCSIEPWPLSLHAIDHVEMVTIGRDAFRRRAGEISRRRADGLGQRGGAAEGARPRGSRTAAARYLQLAMDTGLIHGESVLLIDLNTCTRCDDCVRGCADTHGGTPRFVREGTKFRQWSVPQACYHCTDPVCMIGCPTGAIARAARHARGHDQQGHLHRLPQLRQALPLGQHRRRAVPQPGARPRHRARNQVRSVPRPRAGTGVRADVPAWLRGADSRSRIRGWSSRTFSDANG